MKYAPLIIILYFAEPITAGEVYKANSTDALTKSIDQRLLSLRIALKRQSHDA
jgi:hypothetical protein